MQSFDQKIYTLSQKLSKIPSSKDPLPSEVTRHESFTEIQSKTQQFAKSWEKQSRLIFDRIQKYELHLLQLQKKIDEYYLKETENNKEYLLMAKEKKSEEIENLKKKLVKSKCDGMQLLENRLREMRKQNKQVFKTIKKKCEIIPNSNNPQKSVFEGILSNRGKSKKMLEKDREIENKMRQITQNERIKKQKLMALTDKFNLRVKQIKQRVHQKIQEEQQQSKNTNIKIKRMVALLTDLI